MIGGGLIVAFDLIKFISSANLADIILICPRNKKFDQLPDNIKRLYSPRNYLRPQLRWMLDFFWLPKKIKRERPNLVITLSNLPTRTKLVQLMVNDNAFVSQKSINDLKLSRRTTFKHKIRKKLFWSRLRYVNLLLVQTALEKERFERFNKKLPPIEVLPQLYPSHLNAPANTNLKLPVKQNGSIRIACVAYDWPHKNLNVLSEMLELAKNTNINIEVIFTVNKKAQKSGILKILNNKQLNDYYINVGNIAPNKVASLINQCDGVILPSLIESLSLNYVEAWHCEKPLFLADRPYARSFCKNAAIYFDPYNAFDLLEKLINYFNNPNTIWPITSNGKEIAQHWAYNDKYERLIKSLLSL